MELMEGEEPKSCLGYGKPPWRFRGSALYQLHLVKSEVARALIPKEFRLVEAFGYTLGGFFLANYDESPAGVFNELVVIAGTVWNPPTSCAWAAKVLVNSVEACLHGRKHVGLPSQVAKFSKRECWCPEQRLIMATPSKRRQDYDDDVDVDNHHNGFLNMIGIASTPRSHISIQVSEISSCAHAAATDAFSISMLTSVPRENPASAQQWLGPSVKVSLPSFSGRTEDIPYLLKYSCQMECRVRLVRPINISGLSSTYATDFNQQQDQHPSSSRHPTGGGEEDRGQQKEDSRSRLIVSVMLSKPILTLEFNCLKMNVEAPLIVSQ